jgi:hypothetical protein
MSGNGTGKSAIWSCQVVVFLSFFRPDRIDLSCFWLGKNDATHNQNTDHQNNQTANTSEPVLFPGLTT